MTMLTPLHIHTAQFHYPMQLSGFHLGRVCGSDIHDLIVITNRTVELTLNGKHQLQLHINKYI